MRACSQIAGLRRRLGSTAVYLARDQLEAMTMSTLVTVLSQGQLQQCATPQGLCDNPANQFAAGFPANGTFHGPPEDVLAFHPATGARLAR